jgi:type II secretory pathway pseudopilin PulG
MKPLYSVPSSPYNTPPKKPPPRHARVQLALANSRRYSERGLTLMECLVAILMISAVMVAITPPIFLTVATRVQNRKAEQAMQLANGEIDQMRVLVEQGLTQEILEEVPILKPENAASGTSLTEVPAPASIISGLQSVNASCNDNPTTTGATEAFEQDVDGDCKPDFLVQKFIADPETLERNGVPVPLIFKMGVRVYSLVAKSNLGSEGQQNLRPLAAMYTVMGKGDLSPSLERYCFFADGDAGTCSKRN